MNEPSNELITTQDGSHSIYSTRFEEAYHSKYGAIQESQHVFIEAGLHEVLNTINSSDEEKTPQRTIKIFEMGFGTGLNAFLTYLDAQPRPNLNISYTSIEAYPVEKWQDLNYPQQVETEQGQGANAQVFFQQMHQAEWNQVIALNSNFTLKKIKGNLQDWKTPSNHFDLVYYDAFAPKAQAELWTEAIFQQVYQMMAPNGILTTYCAKGAVKRAMKAVGFTVEGIPGPIGKREMTRACKTLER